MSIKKYFTDNTTYGADDFNAAFSHLISGGVATFSSSASLTAGVTSAISSAVSEGVGTSVPSDCAVVKSGSNYKVSEGVCFLADGSHIAVDADGYEINATVGVKNYIFAEHDTENNTVDIKSSLSPGASGTVPLAEISANGTVTDKRVFAYSKIKTSATAANCYTQITVDTPRCDTKTLLGSYVVPHAFKFALSLGSGDDERITIEFSDTDTAKTYRLTGSALPKWLTIERAAGGVNLYLEGIAGPSSVTLTFV